MTVYENLLAEQDSAYRAFQSKLLPNIDPARVIGVRMPVLRAIAKRLAGSAEADAFLQALPHDYYDENNLHALLLGQERDFDTCIAALDRFLPYVDNWATCDVPAPPVLGQHPDALLPHIRRWMAAPHAYTCRYGIGLLLTHYLDSAFRPEYLQWVAAVRRGEYYVKMMVAWYFATALAKQYDAALPYLLERRLPAWEHNKTVSKALESRRVAPEHKALLRTLRIR